MSNGCASLKRALCFCKYRMTWVEAEEWVIALARAMREEGKTLQEIADTLGYKDRSAVCKMLKRAENIDC